MATYGQPMQRWGFYLVDQIPNSEEAAASARDLCGECCKRAKGPFKTLHDRADRETICKVAGQLLSPFAVHTRRGAGYYSP